jgi:addiction module RelE/StbE family toxin
MIKIVYTSKFLRKYKKLHPNLQEEVKEKIELFRQGPNNTTLKTHKLKGRLQQNWSFWVNYKVRIVFMYDNKNTVALLSIGDHDIYK